MQPLEKSLRNKLEATVKDARDIAEAAACAALEQLGVHEPKPYSYLTEDQRDLRRRLRIHGRQLGDALNGVKDQEIDRLIEEVAYEHWHRMLFARFLSDNNLLMYPDPDDPVAVTLEECEDLAIDEGAANGWELAARFATQMLPQIFRIDSPVFQLALPPEHQQKLERLVAKLPRKVFTASDSLGWVYQFWQAKKKDEVNASEVKIGARELPAVTQLFTEPYMVSFLLDNSLGAWWAARRLTEADLKNASSEEELRQKAAIPGVPLEYLRFVQQEDGTGTPAAGTFDGWPKHLSEFKALDPCCGSGHFLVAALLMLVPMRMELEELTAQEAVDRVLSENIHGLEIDQRCVELAAFNLALTAWRYPYAGGYRALPGVNVACSGLSLGVDKTKWLELAEGNQKLRFYLDRLYDLFDHAPLLGSLINPKSELFKDTIIGIDWEEIAPVLAKALSQESDEEKTEMGVAALGAMRAAELLSSKYHWVITNVPYLHRGKHDDKLKIYCETAYPEAKNELATVFLDRCLNLCASKGTVSIVLPQNWLFQRIYMQFRKKLLRSGTWHHIAWLGPGAFETISGEVVKAILVSINLTVPHDAVIRCIDVSDHFPANEKASRLRTNPIVNINQSRQLDNPDAIVSINDLGTTNLLVKFARAWQGIVTSDDKRYILRYWEIICPNDSWNEFQQAPMATEFFTGRTDIIRWENGKGALHTKAKAHNFPPVSTINKKGVSIQRMGGLNITSYNGIVFDDSVAPLIPNDEKILSSLWCYCHSEEYSEGVRKVNQSVKVVPGSLVNVPFDIDHWTKVATEKYPNGLPNPYTNDPTQWIYHGHPCGSVVWDEEKKWTSHGPLRSDYTVLQVAVARLLGYRWPAELDNSMELADEQREWVKRCKALASYADDDGIVCIPPVRGEAAASDRLLNLLAAAYGDAWSNDTLAALLKSADHADKTLETWLREKFFTQHCKLFQHRPFIWHIWDGLRDGFAALVNYHKFDYKHLETLIYTYLGDWISRQKQDISNGVDGAQEKLAAAENLKKKLELILEGEAPYDIFVRWKPLEKQPIGWNPDLNDGVRLNIRPFMTVPDVGKRGAGVLRDKPNINWNKDRGKDVASAPWYHLGPEYGGNPGDRINDHHLTLAEKRAARA